MGLSTAAQGGLIGARPVAQTSQSERKRIGIKRQSGNARATTKGGSSRPATVGKTDGERGRNQARRRTRPPQRAPAPVASQRHTSYRNTATPGTDGSHERTLRPLATTPSDDSKDTPERIEPAGQTLRTGTRKPPETERQATGNARQKRPDRRRQGRARTNHRGHGRSPPTHARTRAKKRAPGTTRPTTGKTPDAQAKRPPTHKRPPQTPPQESSPGTGTDHATRTRNPGKPRLTDTPEEEANEADAARPNRHEKHRNSRKDSKTRSKQMVVGGNLLEAQEMRGRKLPINPVLLSQNPDKSREFRSIPSEGTIWTATKNGQCPITSELLPQNPA